MFQFLLGVKIAPIKRGETRGGRGRDSRTRPRSLPPPLRFPGVQFNSLPTDPRALLSERLQQAKESSLNVHITLCIHRLFACNVRPLGSFEIFKNANFCFLRLEL